MDRRVKLNNGNIILVNVGKDYSGEIVSISETHLVDGEITKKLELSIWDDMSFNAIINSEEKVNNVEFEFDMNHPFYSCIDQLLDEQSQLIIDDDGTAEKLKKFLIIERHEDLFKIKFVNKNHNHWFDYYKFNIFIKNIGPDCRSKISDYDKKLKIVDFFRNLKGVLLNNDSLSNVGKGNVIHKAYVLKK